MACLISSSFALDCKDSVGGVKAIYLVNWASTGFTVASGEVTATTIASGDVYKYEVPKASSSMVVTTNVSTENGTSFNSAEISFKLRRLSTSKRNELKLLAQTRVFAIVRTNNDEYYLAGKEYGCDVTKMTSNTGTAMGDFAGYDVALSAIEAEAPYKLQSSVVTTLGLS